MLNQTTRIGAYGILIHSGQILLCKLTNSRRWTLPGGGIEFGESPEEAMIREVAEETGLIAKPKELLGIYSFTVAREGHDYHSLQIAFRSEMVGGELSFEVAGSTDMCAWHDIELVKDLDAVELVHFALNKLQSRGT